MITCEKQRLDSFDSKTSAKSCLSHLSIPLAKDWISPDDLNWITQPFLRLDIQHSIRKNNPHRRLAALPSPYMNKTCATKKQNRQKNVCKRHISISSRWTETDKNLRKKEQLERWESTTESLKKMIIRAGSVQRKEKKRRMSSVDQLEKENLFVNLRYRNGEGGFISYFFFCLWVSSVCVWLLVTEMRLILLFFFKEKKAKIVPVHL